MQAASSPTRIPARRSTTSSPLEPPDRRHEPPPRRGPRIPSRPALARDSFRRVAHAAALLPPRANQRHAQLSPPGCQRSLLDFSREANRQHALPASHRADHASVLRHLLQRARPPRISLAPARAFSRQPGHLHRRHRAFRYLGAGPHARTPSPIALAAAAYACARGQRHRYCQPVRTGAYRQREGNRLPRRLRRRLFDGAMAFRRISSGGIIGMTKRIILGAVAILLVIAAAYASFFIAPQERTMGLIQRIFYFHAATAWAAEMTFFVCFLANLLCVWKRQPKYDWLGVSSAEVGLACITVVLITGPIWAHPVWGIWWTWDARLTSTFVLWLLYVSYLLLRT